MATQKQFVFTASTTAEGLKALAEVKARLNNGWDESVIDAISAHYEPDKAMMTLPEKEATSNETTNRAVANRTAGDRENGGRTPRRGGREKAREKEDDGARK